MVRINTILSEDTLEKIDTIIKEKKESRSSFLREAAERLIEEYRLLKEAEVLKERRKRAIEAQDRLRKKAGKWDGVSEIRKWRELRK